ncbi:HPr family phosphocarrier protein [Shouchella clausii]|uniref:PTS system HPr-related protein n=4 Tax=Shouchella TaxID=2893057 RepID=Q5WDJ3_SHOC1|nr:MULTISPECIES: HPr family phosphocarrier protein [Shouchella]ALA54092.1 Catabolite repression HPr-like protein Crh [Shouchella clausii]KKI85393.1 phosphocarrier protein Chr [Shouchella clausii]MBU3229356.1 HPr family phosphocarrier protein [Shouchella clausii]MBU3265422.1 HPr family phosphocarrier protein [Shouchella clausii]MBU3506256.1 HPr family phosphocarrier protein [Shouchella clausii]
MAQKEVTIQLKSGLQARPAAMFVQEANRFSSEVFIVKDNAKVNAKSIMGLMGLALGKGTTITIVTEGHDEKEALDALVAYVENDG